MELFDQRTHTGEDPLSPQPRFDAEFRQGDNQNLASRVAATVEQTLRTACLGRVSVEWRLLLGTVTYFYARGLYPSDEILSAVEPTQLGLKLGHLGSAEAIRELRRYHRETLQRCLGSVLDSETEATARIDRAIRLDSFALDF